MSRLFIFPPDLTKSCTLAHDVAGWTIQSYPGSHPSNGAPAQVFDIPNATPNENGVSLTIPGTIPTLYHGILYLDLPTGAGIVIDVFPFRPATASTSARRGLVRLAGRMLLDDDGPFNPLGTTLFWALGWYHKGDRERLKQNLQWAKNQRVLDGRPYDFVRILGQVAPSGLWANCPIDPRWPSYQRELGEVIDLAYECGLRVKLTLVGGGDPDPVDTARQVAAVVAGREHKILLLEPVNEHNADVDDAKRMVPILQATGCLVVPGFGDITPGWTISDIKDLTLETGADGCALHTERSAGDNGARPVRQCWDFHLFSMMADDGEGPGPESSVASFPDPFQNAAKAAGNKICGASLRCNHTGSGIYGITYQGPTGMRYADLWEQPNAVALFQAVRHADDHLRPEIANWRKFNTNPPVEIYSGAVNKLYGAIDDATGRFAEIAIGCETAIVCRATRPVHVQFWNPATGAACGEITLITGQMYQPSVALWAYVITGEAL